MRSFTSASALDSTGLTLELAPALTPEGLTEAPEFFSGFAAQPLVLARGLLVLADVAQTRYFQPTPSGMRDPICTANGDRLRFEAFSACNTVGVRLDLLAAAFDGGDIHHGTTNVDINQPLRETLGQVSPSELMHLAVGNDELRVSTLDATHVERKVELPDRWLKALGSSQELTRELELIGEAPAVQTRQFLATLPSGTGRRGHWSVSRMGVKPALRPGKGTVYAEGLNRLRAARRLGPQITRMRVYGLPQAPMAASVWEFSLPHGRLTFTLTAEHYRGFSGEGALLTKLAAPTAVDDSALISACLAFEPRIEIASLVAETGLDEERTGQGLAVLAGDGRVGFDLYEQAYFHRELPSDADRVIKDNPRLRHAKRLVTAGAVRPFDEHPGAFRVRGDHDDYIVRTDPPSCTCPWWRGHTGSRGVCKRAEQDALRTRLNDRKQDHGRQVSHPGRTGASPPHQPDPNHQGSAG